MLNAVGQAQHILLIGGTSEIGLGIVEEFLSRGPAKVTLAARKGSPRIEAARAELKQAGAEVVTVDFDALDTDSHPEVIQTAFADGDVDVAVVAFGTLGDQEALWRTPRPRHGPATGLPDRPGCQRPRRPRPRRPRRRRSG